MVLDREHIRKVAIGGALVGAFCLMLGELPQSVQMTIDLFFLIAVLFITLLQDRKLRQQTVAGTSDAA